MKRLITLIIFIVTLFGCSEEQKQLKENTDPISKQNTETLTTVGNTQEKKDSILSQVSDFPIIKDTAEFITDLRQIFDLEVDEGSYQKANDKITTYKKVKIYGSEKDYVFIEYDYGNGCGAAFPWKYQLLLTTEGKPVKSLSGQRFEFLDIFKNQHPFLLTVVGTSKGNGGHELFRISGDTLENVYEGYYKYDVRTYDAHHDSKIYEPSELKLEVNDFNNDGINDLAFVGKIVFIQGQTKDGDYYDRETINGKTVVTYSVDNPFKKIPVEFIFLYDKETNHFKAKEDYSEIYELYK